jgi:hypothetical protein
VTVDDLVGRAGIVRSVLNPEGHVYIDGALWRARWTGEAKRAKVGTPVRVHGVDGRSCSSSPSTRPLGAGGGARPSTTRSPTVAAAAAALAGVTVARHGKRQGLVNERPRGP